MPIWRWKSRRHATTWLGGAINREPSIQVGKLSLQNAAAIFGHVFVGFLCLHLYCRILNQIKQAGLSAHLAPQGLLLKLSKIYTVVYEEEKRMTEALKQMGACHETQTRSIP
jgi:transposase